MSKGWLRWAGSKYRSLHALKPILEGLEYELYVEPFVGAGTVFFRLARPVPSVLSDLNRDVTSFYQFLKHDPKSLSEELAKLETRVSKSYYAGIRTRFNTLPLGLERAATFFFLNRTCFNGIYRVNKQGEFNVPYGQRKKFQFPSIDELSRLSTILQRATILHVDFRETLRYAHPGALFYLDPPYTSGYRRYAWPPFGQDDLERLQEFILALVQSGAHVIVSYAGCRMPWFVPATFSVRAFKVLRSISSDGARGQKFEVCAYFIREDMLASIRR